MVGKSLDHGGDGTDTPIGRMAASVAETVAELRERVQGDIGIGGAELAASLILRALSAARVEVQRRVVLPRPP